MRFEDPTDIQWNCTYNHDVCSHRLMLSPRGVHRLDQACNGLSDGGGLCAVEIWYTHGGSVNKRDLEM